MPSAAPATAIAPSTAVPPLPADSGREAFLSLLLHLERAAREAASQQELAFVIVNGTRKITGAQQIFLLDMAENRAGLRAMSDVAVPDANAPFAQWIARMAARMAEEAGASEPRIFVLPAYCGGDEGDTGAYPFKHFLWAPLKTRGGAVFAGLLLARERAWSSGDIPPAARLAGAYQHAWQALAVPDTAGRPQWRRRLLPAALFAGLAAAGFIPVPLTALAPAEVVARHPAVIAAPLDGVIDSITAEPNAPIEAGAEIFRFVDTVSRNRHQAAVQAVEVASAKFRRFQQAALDDIKSRHELAIAQAELGVALSEEAYAREVLSKTTVTAPAAGIVILADKDYWKGRPVATGEQILQIARPDDVEIRIDLSVRDAIVLHEGARVDVYLDAAPLSRTSARLTHASYQAQPSETQTLVYHVRASLTGEAGQALRIGARGTAKIYGDTVPLFFYLFRRPISVIRQSIGL